MSNFPLPPHNTRLGFHYFPDTAHYRQIDLLTWLPELRQLGVSWLTLIAPTRWAIPEAFICGLLGAGIEPVLHFHLPVGAPLATAVEERRLDLDLLFKTYARWGVHYVALFDRPNLRAAWPASGWTQSQLVERFLDLYLPLAESALQTGLIPVFPPLEPGGDYWDTAFLRGALQGIQRRGSAMLLRRMVLGAYAWAGNRPLSWGCGGPERWPMAKPYEAVSGEQDQRGFRIFDWYLALAEAELGAPCQIILMKAGSRPGDACDPRAAPVDAESHAQRNLAIARWLDGEASPQEEADCGDQIPSEVLACNFWLLSASASDPAAGHAWFPENREALPAVNRLRQWAAGRQITPALPGPERHPIDHYLLLPTYEWGVARLSARHLEVIRPYVKKYRPTIGFSISEAIRARHVTIFGRPQDVPGEALDQLVAAGCTVEHLGNDDPNDGPFDD